MPPSAPAAIAAVAEAIMTGAEYDVVLGDDALLQSGQGIEDFVGGGRWVFALNGLVVERPQGVVDEGIPLVATEARYEVILVESRAAGQRQDFGNIRPSIVRPSMSMLPL